MIDWNSLLATVRHSCSRVGLWGLVAVVVIVAAPVSRCVAATSEIDTTDSVGLQNDRVAITFDRRSGALVSLRNLDTDDEYLKGPENDGNPFRLYVDPRDDMPPAAKLNTPFMISPVEDAMGGLLVDPRDCRVIKASFSRVEGGGELEVLSRHRIGWNMRLTVTLPDDDVAATLTLKVYNSGARPHRVMTAFPYLTGVSLGDDRATNLGVKLRQWGMPAISAWQDVGWIYPIWNMQWNAVYEPTRDEGLGLIMIDPEPKPGRIFRRFEPSGMSVMHYPAVTLRPDQGAPPLTAQLLVHRGGWRFTALRYREAIMPLLEPARRPAWLADMGGMAGGLTFPSPEQVAAMKSQAVPPTTFHNFADLPYNFLVWPYDTLARGGWQASEAEGMFSGYTGDYLVRADLGGAEALREGIEKVHADGRQILLILAFHTIHRDAAFMKGRNPRDFWLQPAPNADFDEAVTNKNFFACMGYKAWQDQLIGVCTRLLRETGADGFYLDEGGGTYWPCFNPAHHHPSPYNLGEPFWGVEFHRRLREAMDEVNPDSILTAESVSELLTPYVAGSHFGEPPDWAMPPFRAVFPDYIADTYAPVIPAMLNHLGVGDGGAMSNVRPPDDAIEYHEQIQGKGGVAPSFAWFEGMSPEMIKQRNPMGWRWMELRPTFHGALVRGDFGVSHPQPMGVRADDYVARLWRGPDYALLCAGHVAGWPLPKPVTFRVSGLDGPVTHAMEYDLASLEAEPTRLVRSGDDVLVAIRHGFSAVLLATPTTPPLVGVEMQRTANKGTAFKVRLRATAPWRRDKGPVSVQVSVPGLLTPRDVTLPAELQVTVPPDAAPGWYYLRVKGDCLPVKRDIRVPQ